MSGEGKPDVPGRIVNAAAPIRICDNGGWTDTWFAKSGKVFNIAVSPCVEVQVELVDRDSVPDRVTIRAENYADSLVVGGPGAGRGKHELIEAAIDRATIPSAAALRVTIYSDSPAGSSTGTSASLLVALLGALDCAAGGRLTRGEVAEAAHAVEVDALGRQSGIQDQHCAAYGGISFIEMAKYPHGRVTSLDVREELRWELNRRLALVYLGKGHSSTQIHETIIRSLESGNPSEGPLRKLRIAAERSRDAILAGDFGAFGAAMIGNTEAQRELHPSLVCADADRVIAIARAHGAEGWKVNGAGGDGGSLTILFGHDAHQKRSALREIESENPLFRNIPIAFDRDGLRVW